MLSLWRQLVRYRHPIAAWAVLRVITSAAAAFAVRFSDAGSTVAVHGYSPPRFGGLGGYLVAPWLRADALWYLKISRQGYGATDGTIAFFPVYPALVSITRPLFGGNEVLAAIFVSSLATLIGMLLLYRFVEILVSKPHASVAVWGLALYPAAFFFMAPYAEGLFLLFSAWALLSSRRGGMTGSALAGAFAAMTRPFGFLLCIPMYFLARQKMAPIRALMAAAGPLAGLGLWLIFAARVTGDPLGGLAVQARWQRQPAFFPITIVEGFRSWLSYSSTDLGSYFLVDLAATFFGFALLAGVFKVLRTRSDSLGVGGYGAGALLLPLSSVFAPRPLLSMPRFVLALAPLFLSLGVLPRSVRLALAAMGAVGLFALTIAFISARPIF